jgi:hypothetical protein
MVGYLMVFRDTAKDGTTRLTGGLRALPLVMFKATRAGGSFASGVPIAFNSLSFNEGNAAWDGTVYTIPISGYYEIKAQFKNTNATPYATNFAIQRSTDDGNSWGPVNISFNNPGNAFGGNFIIIEDYFVAGQKFRVVPVNGNVTLQSDAPSENTFFTVRLLSYAGQGVAFDGVKQSPNIVNLVGNMGTSNPVAVLSFTVQENAKIKLTGYMTAYTTVANMKTVTVTANGVTSTVGHLFFNETNSHKPIPIDGLLGPFPAGTYTLTFNLLGSNAFIDANDFYNITMQEVLPGGWTAPDVVDSGWIYVGAAGAPAFQNGWLNYDARTARFRKVGPRVQLEGVIKSGTVGQPIFFLPVGFRPRNAVYADLNIPVISNGVLGHLGVGGSDGRVVLLGGSNVYADLSPVTFLADN